MSDERPRESLLLPILIPVGVLVVIVSVLLLFSRVLLDLSATAATATALAVAASILALASFIAFRPKVDGSTTLAFVGGAFGAAMLIGGLALMIGQPGEEEGNEAAIVALSAPPNAAVDGFSPTSLTAPANEPFVIEFDNADPGVLHNVQIFTDAPDAGGEGLFGGELVTGPIVVQYEIEALEPGTYFFNCEVHPATMTGTLEVAEGGGEGGGATEGTVVVAKDISFDTDLIELPADTETQITLDNQDEGTPHNMSIYTDETAAESVFKGEIFSGIAQQTYTVPPLAAGEYFFHCDVHPNMNGSVVVGGGSAEPSEPTETESPPPETETPEPTETESPPSTEITITAPVGASNSGFAETSISAPADTPFTIVFKNDDTGVPHNVEIFEGTDATGTVASAPPDHALITGVDEVTYEVPALAAGTYFYNCFAHPATMTGTLTVA